MQRTCRTAAIVGLGRMGVVEVDLPDLGETDVLVEVHASLVSPGTELGGWRAFAEERGTEAPDRTPRPFGYANAGVVRETGARVQGLAVGDRVACMGSGARHATHAAVAQNLCAPLPDGLSFADGAYAHLAATALHAVRRLEPELGARYLVVGLGLVGQLAAQFVRAAGAPVIGWEGIARRVERARSWGIDEALVVDEPADSVAPTRAFTGDLGLDGAVFAFTGDALSTLDATVRCLRATPDGHPVGAIVDVGNVTFPYAKRHANIDLRRSARTGPGYHDPAWEAGADYPRDHVRWTTRANLDACLRLAAEGRVDFGALTTHTVPLSEAGERVDALLDTPDEVLGLVFETQR